MKAKLEQAKARIANMSPAQKEALAKASVRPMLATALGGMAMDFLDSLGNAKISVEPDRVSIAIDTLYELWHAMPVEQRCNVRLDLADALDALCTAIDAENEAAL